MIDTSQYDTTIRNIGKILTQDYSDHGDVRCGINSPYDDAETEVRDLCHLIIVTVIEIDKFQQVQ